MPKAKERQQKENNRKEKNVVTRTKPRARTRKVKVLHLWEARRSCSRLLERLHIHLQEELQWLHTQTVNNKPM